MILENVIGGEVNPNVFNDNIERLEITTSQSWKVPHTGKYAVIICGGGGSGGGASKSYSIYGVCGGQGGGVDFAIIDMIKDDEYDVIIGAGGTGITSNVVSEGNSGGNSLFGDLLKCQGGAGGIKYSQDGNFTIGDNSLTGYKRGALPLANVSRSSSDSYSDRDISLHGTNSTAPENIFGLLQTSQNHGGSVTLSVNGTNSESGQFTGGGSPSIGSGGNASFTGDAISDDCVLGAGSGAAFSKNTNSATSGSGGDGICYIFYMKQ